VGSWQDGSALQRHQPAVTLQTGFARAFQLNLGGTFGDGPGWQNRVILDFPNVVAKGDGITMNGWMTVDAPSGRRDWIAGVGCRAPARRIGRGTLAVTAGWQRWLFPSVLGGVRDHLAAVNGSYRVPWKLPFTVPADQWVNFHSAHSKGSLTLIQSSVARAGLHVLERAAQPAAVTRIAAERPAGRPIRRAPRCYNTAVEWHGGPAASRLSVG
jgi:hypothetical protein